MENARPNALDLQEFRRVSAERSRQWGDKDEFGRLYRSNGMGGEGGEVMEAAKALTQMMLLASFGAAIGKSQNIVKKMERTRLDVAGGISEEQGKQNLADELADVFIYLDLLAASYDINLEEAIRSKFNRISVKYGFPQRI